MSNFTIQSGIWVNHDRPAILGATLTVSIRWGNYLIAALSSLVAWAGAASWNLAAFWMHQRLAQREDGRDVLHQQLQVHFRAGGSFIDSWNDSLSLHRAWSGRAPRVKRRTLGLAAVALAAFLLFAAAGVFVAEVATSSYQAVLVLAAPSDCGDFRLDQNSSAGETEWLDEITKYQNDAEFWARNYAREAYNESRGQDSPFAHPTLPFNSRYVACPYTEGIRCLGPNRTDGPAWMMESDALDSHVHLGMNALKKDRVVFKSNAICAVVDATNLTTAPYWRVDTVRGTPMNQTYVGILQQFGPDLGYDSNLVFEVPLSLQFQRTGFFSQRAMFTPGKDGPDKAVTGPPFGRNDANSVTVTTTSGLMFYYGPVDDPFFLAHDARVGDEYAYNMNVTVYYSSQTFGLMNCAEQMQLCNPTTGECSSHNGSVGLADVVRSNSLGFNDAQRATALRILATVQYVGSFLSQVARGTTGLLIAEQNGVRAGGSVPADQWTKESSLWFAAGLTTLQRSLLQWTVKPWWKGQAREAYSIWNDSLLDWEYSRAGDGVLKAKQKLCYGQLVRSSAAVQNFSVLAVVLVLVGTTVLIVTSLVLPECVERTRAQKKIGSHGEKSQGLSRAAEAARVARMADEKFNLLAMALRDGAGLEGWERGKTHVPVVVAQEACLPEAAPLPKSSRGKTWSWKKTMPSRRATCPQAAVIVPPPVERDGLASYAPAGGALDKLRRCATCNPHTSSEVFSTTTSTTDQEVGIAEVRKVKSVESAAFLSDRGKSGTFGLMGANEDVMIRDVSTKGMAQEVEEKKRPEETPRSDAGH